MNSPNKHSVKKHDNPLRQQRRRWEFESHLVAINEEFEIPPGRNASKDAPMQFAYVRRTRRRMVRARLHRDRNPQ